MGQAFDHAGHVLGDAFGHTKREVFDKLIARFPAAHEIRVSSLDHTEGVTQGPSIEMPRYHSHKDVWALKIRDITDPNEPGNENDGSRLLHFEETGYGARRVSADFVRRHLPLLEHAQDHPYRGGYFVVYKDGYESFSPAKAFEEGYTRTSDEA